jgi:protein gp37
MKELSKIEWTDATWNFILGCDKCSPGCAGCYALKDVARMAGNPNPNVSAANKGLVYRQENGLLNWTGGINYIPKRLAKPFEWPDRMKVFVNSLSDAFHESVPLEVIRRAFAVMRSTPWHNYQVLTKRADNLERLSGELDWPANVWQGVSVENQANAYRVDHLRRTGAKVKFLSVEPLLGPVELDLTGIDWVIVGGESGPTARPFDPAWALSVRDQCRRFGVKFFFKQHGSFLVGDKRRDKKANGRLLDGVEYSEMPEVELVAVPPRKERLRLKAQLVPEAEEFQVVPLGTVRRGEND